MQWSADGLIIGVRRHGETSVILEAMVVDHGRCLGLVRGGRSRRQAAVLQPGNTVALTWRARLEDHLGLFAVDLITARAARLIEDRTKLYAFQLAADHLRLLPERDPHNERLGEILALIDGDADPIVLGTALARLEMHLLDDLGFGLDLAACAVTGDSDGLAYVSPRSGRAVTREGAGIYADRLLALPGFFVGDDRASAADIAAAFRLTGHFLNEHVWGPRQIAPPSTRETLIAALSGL
ncbi:MAG: DNA repair protein RecO [Alphaproteobacteria bacterium]|nr:DNA repair protein RecO [Alphaproteobacteria bacterium]